MKEQKHYTVISTKRSYVTRSIFYFFTKDKSYGFNKSSCIMLPDYALFIVSISKNCFTTLSGGNDHIDFNGKLFNDMITVRICKSKFLHHACDAPKFIYHRKNVGQLKRTLIHPCAVGSFDVSFSLLAAAHPARLSGRTGVGVEAPPPVPKDIERVGVAELARRSTLGGRLRHSHSLRAIQ